MEREERLAATVAAIAAENVQYWKELEHALGVEEGDRLALLLYFSVDEKTSAESLGAVLRARYGYEVVIGRASRWSDAYSIDARTPRMELTRKGTDELCEALIRLADEHNGVFYRWKAVGFNFATG